MKNSEILQKFLEDVKSKEDSKVNIILHSSPDPDAVGSGVAFQVFLKSQGIESDIYYNGEVSHPQNKTIMNVLNIAMIKSNEEISGNNACLDCTPHNSIAKDAMLIIDHHKVTNGNTPYKIILPSYGACATIVWQLIKDTDLDTAAEEIDIYTALLLGIRTDTNDLISENMSKDDFVAYQELLEKSDKEAIQKVMNYPFPRYLYEKRLALHEKGNSSETNGIFVGGVGFITASQRDAIAILAEEYARMESVTTAVIFSIIDKKYLEVSVRSSNVSLDVNQMCQDLFGSFGGGTSYKGGAKIPLTFYEDVNDVESLWKITCRHMFRKVFKESWAETTEE